RRITLRADVRLGGIELVLPRGVSRAEGLRFAVSKADWIKARLDDLPPRIRFTDGAIIPVLGTRYRIRWQRQGRLFEAEDRVELRGRQLWVSGTATDLPASVRAWLRALAQAELTRRSRRMAARIARRLSRVSLRDPRTRWGSCSPRGSLSYSWRLILAPDAVIDYVVAHEVAHLAEMNHGPRFWTIVRSLCRDVEGAREWLRTEGAALHRYG
ncbi:MAG: M48 family metallopeptidase, partial [Alphaproteobacteria bacterium]|nr:M48 family metallopeptidase [Alphaproteobacteria bacterium]